MNLKTNFLYASRSVYTFVDTSYGNFEHWLSMRTDPPTVEKIMSVAEGAPIAAGLHFLPSILQPVAGAGCLFHCATLSPQEKRKAAIRYAIAYSILCGTSLLAKKDDFSTMAIPLNVAVALGCLLVLRSANKEQQKLHKPKEQKGE